MKRKKMMTRVVVITICFTMILCSISANAFIIFPADLDYSERAKASEKLVEDFKKAVKKVSLATCNVSIYTQGKGKPIRSMTNQNCAQLTAMCAILAAALINNPSATDYCGPISKYVVPNEA